MERPERGVAIRRQMISAKLPSPTALSSLPYTDYDYSKVKWTHSHTYANTHKLLPVSVRHRHLFSSSPTFLFSRSWVPAARMWLATCPSLWAWLDLCIWMESSSKFPWQPQKAAWLPVPTVVAEQLLWVSAALFLLYIVPGEGARLLTLCNIWNSSHCLQIRNSLLLGVAMLLSLLVEFVGLWKRKSWYIQYD